MDAVPDIPPVPAPEVDKNASEETTTTTSEPTEQPTVQEDDNVLLDFTMMFKKGAVKRPPKLASDKLQENKPAVANWLLEIPTKLSITLDDLKQRKVLDQRRWHSLTKAVEAKHSAVAAVASCWNYLHSRVGMGKLQPLSVKKALQILQMDSQPTQLNPHSCQSNQQLQQLYACLCKKFDVPAKTASNPLAAVISTNCQNTIKQDLKGNSRSYIYHCFGHFLCVLGYEVTPGKPLQAYKKLEQIVEQETQLWLILGETVRDQPVFHVKKWKDIQTDFETQWPMYFDIRQSAKGQQRHPEANESNQVELRKFPHCFVGFEKVDNS